MSRYELNPQVEKYMDDHSVELEKALNQLGMNWDEAYIDVHDYDSDSDDE